MSSLLRCAVSLLVILVASGSPLLAQYGGYGGMYDESPSPDSAPDVTPTPEPPGRISLSLKYVSAAGMRSFPASIDVGDQLEIQVRLDVVGQRSGDYRLSALVLDSSGGTVSPTRTSLGGPGLWKIRYSAPQNVGGSHLLVVAQDATGKHHAASTMAMIDVGLGAPDIIASGMSILPNRDSAELRIHNYSWAEQVSMRNFVHPEWMDNLAEDLYQSHAWKNTISDAMKINRDRLNITHTLPPKEEFKSYANIEPLISRYWADTGIMVSTGTANEIGNLALKWRAQPELKINIHPSIASELALDTRPVKIGRVLNGVGAVMILLDFWSNMTAAETPVEAREAWHKAGYASLDLCFANIVGSTFGAAAALPGMWASYILTNSYDTLISGHKKCWFNKFVEQAIAQDYLSEDIHDTQAVEKVKAAMKSPGGLTRALKVWWGSVGSNWQGEQGGGCGNWNLAVARGYTEAFAERIQKTTEVEIHGKRIHPWSFYYSVSRLIVLDRERELAREAAENLKRIEAAYLSDLATKQYRGNFRLITSKPSAQPLRGVRVCLAESEGGGSCGKSWKTNVDGNFKINLGGHQFSPTHKVLLSVHYRGKNYLYIVPQSAFEEVLK